jgi:hypothetical protein
VAFGEVFLGAALVRVVFFIERFFVVVAMGRAYRAAMPCIRARAARWSGVVSTFGTSAEIRAWRDRAC